MTNPSDPRKTDKPEGERTVPDVPQPLPPDEAEENEEVVASFLSGHPDFQLIPPSSPEGVERWVGEDSFVRTFPATHLWDGLFAALMVRNS